MNLEKKRLWGLRAGKKGSAHRNFIDDGMVVLADAEMGDLAELEATRDAFYEKYRGLHLEDTRTGSAGIAGKFFRFAVEMSKGDLVVYPALPDKQIYVGEITGEYSFIAESDFPHQRSVTWKYVIPKSEFTTQARYELGAARTLFEVKRNREEVVRRISDEGVTKFKARKKAKARA